MTMSPSSPPLVADAGMGVTNGQRQRRSQFPRPSVWNAACRPEAGRKLSGPQEVVRCEGGRAWVERQAGHGTCAGGVVRQSARTGARGHSAGCRYAGEKRDKQLSGVALRQTRLRRRLRQAASILAVTAHRCGAPGSPGPQRRSSCQTTCRWWIPVRPLRAANGCACSLCSNTGCYRSPANAIHACI